MSTPPPPQCVAIFSLQVGIIIERCILIVSPDESLGYLGFSMVMQPPPPRFPFGCYNLKNILVRPFKFGMWVHMGNTMTGIVL